MAAMGIHCITQEQKMQIHTNFRSKECRFLQEKSIYKFQEQIPQAKHVTRIDARYVASVGKRDMYISSLTFLQWHVPGNHPPIPQPCSNGFLAL